jgi:hypothetical protein
VISACEKYQSVGPMDCQYVEAVNHSLNDVCCHHSVVLTHGRQQVACGVARVFGAWGEQSQWPPLTNYKIYNHLFNFLLSFSKFKELLRAENHFLYLKNSFCCPLCCHLDSTARNSCTSRPCPNLRPWVSVPNTMYLLTTVHNVLISKVKNILGVRPHVVTLTYITMYI